jgi:hypothetical protein
MHERPIPSFAPALSLWEQLSSAAVHPLWPPKRRGGGIHAHHARGHGRGVRGGRAAGRGAGRGAFLAIHPPPPLLAIDDEPAADDAMHVDDAPIGVDDDLGESCPESESGSDGEGGAICGPFGDAVAAIDKALATYMKGLRRVFVFEMCLGLASM